MGTCGMFWMKFNDYRTLKKHSITVITNVLNDFKTFIFGEVFLT